MAFQPQAIQVYGALGASHVGAEVDALISKGLIREVGQSVSLPTGVKEVSLDELKSLFGKAWYKAWWLWALVGTAIVGGGGFWYMKRRKPKRRK